MKQIPFLGKKSVPAALRKDLWRPMAAVSFPVALQGLQAYRKLREFRKMHELSWDPEDFRVDEHHMMSKKQRGRKLMDQKANTVADLAAVLHQQEQAGEEAKLLAEAQTRYKEETEEMARPRAEGRMKWIEQKLAQTVPELPPHLQQQVEMKQEQALQKKIDSASTSTTTTTPITPDAPRPAKSLSLFAALRSAVSPSSTSTTTPTTPSTPPNYISKNARKKLLRAAAAQNAPPPTDLPPVLTTQRRASLLHRVAVVSRTRARAQKLLDAESQRLNLRFLPETQGRKLLQRRLAQMDAANAAEKQELRARQLRELRAAKKEHAIAVNAATATALTAEATNADTPSDAATTESSPSASPLPALRLAQARAASSLAARHLTLRNKTLHRARAQLRAARTDQRRVRNLGSGVDGVVVRWKELLDAEFAQSWPAPVVHEVLEPYGEGRGAARGGRYEIPRGKGRGAKTEAEAGEASEGVEGKGKARERKKQTA